MLARQAMVTGRTALRVLQHGSRFYYSAAMKPGAGGYNGPRP